MAGQIARIRNIVKAEIEDVLGRMENPKKMVNQMLIDMEHSFNDAVGEVSRAIANEKVIERRLRKAEAEVDQLQKDAEAAVASGDDDAARRALDAKVSIEASRDTLKTSLDEARSAASAMRAQLADLRAKLESARNRRHTLVARKHATQSPGAASSSLDRTPFDDFDRLVSDVERDEIASQVYQEVSDLRTTSELDRVEREQKVKQQLAELKRRSAGEEG